jgi:hypothetical protein
VVVGAADADLKDGFGLKGGAGRAIGISRGYPSGEDKEVGKREEFTEAPVEEDVMCGKDALHLGYVVVFYTPIRGDWFGASDIEECFRAGLCVVVHSDMGGHDSCD